MQSIITDRVSKLQAELKEKFKLLSTVSLTIDIWSDRQTRGGMGVTAHCIDEGKFKNSVLAVDRFKGKCFIYKKESPQSILFLCIYLQRASFWLILFTRCGRFWASFICN